MLSNGIHDDAASAASASSENEPASTLKDHLRVALREFHYDSDKPSQAILTRIWPELRGHYKLPDRIELYPLTTTTVSDILGGKRQGLPPWKWVASFVLACQLYAVRSRPGRRDQGTAVLGHWKAIYAAHSPAGNGPSPSWQLTEARKAFAAAHGPYGETLITGAELGHPHARYRLAILLATSPEHSDEAASLIADVAGTAHAPSLDLLDVFLRSQTPDPGGTGPQPPLIRAEAGRIAYEFASKARDRGESNEDYAFRRAAASAGVPEDAIDIASLQLDETDPHAARWLTALLTTPASGRRRTTPANRT